MNCPTDSEMLRYHADECAVEERSAITRHLEQCRRCATQTDRMRIEHDDLVARLRRVGAPPTSTPARPKRPAPTLPGYEIRGEISRGGQGIVYRAWQCSTRREVAIKVLRDGLDAGPLAERRFEREIEAVAALRHPGVVQVFDSGQMEDGRRYIVMDYVAGLPLDQFVRVNACDLPTRLRLFSALCDAVHHAHQRGVIHRDLKPSNILVSSDGQPCVLDFGLARQLTDRADRGQTLSGHVAGTLAYLSPEQARGLPDAIDVRSDVYTLGVLAYRLVCGGPPYPLDRDTVQVLQAIADETPPVPLQLAAGDGVAAGRVPADLETVLLTALAKDRERRYQTAEALADDVRSFLDGEPIGARRDSGWYLLRMLLRRYRHIAVLGAALVLVSIGSAVALGWLYSEQKTQREAAEAARSVADERYMRLRRMAKAYIFDLDPKIRRLPGTAPARAFMVSTALEYLDALHSEVPDDPQLTYELAHAYAKIGEVLGDLNTSATDDLPAALTQFERSRALCEHLLEQDPDEFQAASLLQKTLNQIGDAHRNLRQTEQAGIAYRQALELAERLAARRPDNPLTINKLANSYERIGNQLLEEGDPEAAEDAYRTSMAHGARYHALRPDDLWALRGTGVSRTKLASMALRRGESEVALEHYRAFLAISDQLAAAFPNDRVAQRDVAVAEEWHCILLTELGRAREALPHCERSVAVFDRLLQHEPGSRSLREALATKLTKLSETELKLGQDEAAAATIGRLIALTEQLAADSTDRGRALRLLGVAHYKDYELHKQSAERAASPPADRVAAWDRAEAALTRCRETFLRSREEGVLSASDAAVPESLAAELAQLRVTRESVSR